MPEHWQTQVQELGPLRPDLPPLLDQSEVSTGSRDQLSANHSSPADHGAELPAGEGDEAAARALVAHQEVAEDEVRALSHADVT